MKNIVMLDETSKPFSRTYLRRAINLVKKGRANWVNDSTIQLTEPSHPSHETEDLSQMTDEMITINIPSAMSIEGEATPIEVFSDEETTPWVEYFKSLAERLTESEELAKHAIDAIKQSSSSSDHPDDRPCEGIARIFETHMKTRSELTKNLMEFVNRRRLK